MNFDELWRRNLTRKDPDIPSLDSQGEASFFRDPAFGNSAFEDLDETEMSRFLQWLEASLMIDDLGGHGA
ncbi:MAG: hypothetical protein JO217_04375 [Acidobacteriaceae bacterium]|nr:hypothetical protein [Acidobacteriaceae bacterium]MBV9441910.1 hypothetical protein [Acidobacteriaceae bacterium]